MSEDAEDEVFEALEDQRDVEPGEMEEVLEELRVRRHDLNPETRKTLKPFEDAIRYGVEGLNGEHYLDPNHLIESIAKAALPEERIATDKNVIDTKSLDSVAETVPEDMIETSHLGSEGQRIDRDPGRPMDQIIEDLPQTAEEADEFFSQSPEKSEMDRLDEKIEELKDKTDVARYQAVLYDAIMDGDIGYQDVDSLIDYNERVLNVMLNISQLGTKTMTAKMDGEEVENLDVGRTELPETPQPFARRFTAGMMRGFNQLVGIAESEESNQSSYEPEDDREPLKQYQQEIKVDDAALPDEASTFESQLFDAGARYNHEADSEVDVDMMRKIIRDVRDLEVDEDLLPSYEEKQAEAYGDLKGAVEAVLEDSDIGVGRGAGNRQSLNQLVAGIRYTESQGAVYEEETVIER
jgi:hypothetical protein